MSDADALIPAAPLPVPSLPPGWDGDRLIELAREVAMNITGVPAILAQHNIPQAVYDDICRVPFYARALEAFRAEWESATNTNKRLGVKAAMV